MKTPYEIAVTATDNSEIVSDLEQVLVDRGLDADRGMDAAGMLAVEILKQIQETGIKPLLMAEYFDAWVSRIRRVAGIVERRA